MQDRSNIGSRFGLRIIQFSTDRIDDALSTGGRNKRPQRAVKNAQTYRVALPDGQVGQARRHHLGIVQFGDLAGTVAHRRAGVQQ